MLKIKSFVAIKILFHYDCFNKDSGCLHTTTLMGNFNSNCVFLCFYMDMNCFGLLRVVSSSFQVGSVAADSFGWVVTDGFGWLLMISVGFGWFRMISGGLLF